MFGKPVPAIEIVVEQGEVVQKEEHISNYIKAIAAIEEEMEPLKEHKRDLKINYIENEWLSKDEISMAVKAYRLLKGDTDMEQLMDFYDRVSKTVTR
jgi:uncharacterized protein YacL (UPF0231 family)|tara:strand:+ start:304 stop:594 length:291 start_codon:yes stop_codon:yes gene_type:complete